MDEHFLIWAMSFESTSLSGFSFTDLGRAFWSCSNATDFRFLGIFIAERRWENGKEWNGRTDQMMSLCLSTYTALFHLRWTIVVSSAWRRRSCPWETSVGFLALQCSPPPVCLAA